MSEQTGQDVGASDATETTPPKYSRFHAFAQHGEHAQRAYNSLHDLPESFQHEFLKTLDEKPSTNVEELADRIRAKAEGRTVPEPADRGAESSTSENAVEAKPAETQTKNEPPTSATGNEPEKTNERISALEIQVRELGSSVDNLKTSEAGDVQQRLAAVEGELDRLRREQSKPARRLQGSRTLPSRFETIVNVIAALIFVALLAIAAAYVNKWPAGVW